MRALARHPSHCIVIIIPVLSNQKINSFLRGANEDEDLVAVVDGLDNKLASQMTTAI